MQVGPFSIAGRYIYQAVTDKIIAQLEAGTALWMKPWTNEATSCDLPKNAISRKYYRGVNTFLLEAPDGAIGNAWMTFKQAKDIGANVRKGEKGQMIVFFKPWTVEDVNSTDGTEKTIHILRSFTLFHTSRIEKLPAKYLPVIVEQLPEAERIAHAEKILAQAKITHGGDHAFYRPSTDSITLPAPEQFKTVGDYYATAMHELTHWTGAKARCNRDFTGRFGDTAYAREELVAEMGAAFLLKNAQIEGEMQHAAYLASWLEVLRSDKRAIINAASAAQKAVDFIMQVSAAEVEKEDAEVA